MAQRRPIFHSEADFQFALAWHIHESMPDAEVRLEFKPFPDESMFLDIWIPTTKTAIELKYPTRKADLESGGERFTLAEHSAQPLRRYDFLKDIERIERVAADVGRRGIAVLLTNVQSYWSNPAARWRTSIDSAFRVHEGKRVTGNLAWSDSAGPGTIRGREAPIFLKGSYDLRWKDYSTLPGTGQGRRFRYLAVEVG